MTYFDSQLRQTENPADYHYISVQDLSVVLSRMQELPPLLKQLETEAELKAGKPWAEMFVQPALFLAALKELRKATK